MGVGSMTPRLHPLQAGGGSSSGLPYGFPTLVNARLKPGLAWWDDFFTVSAGTAAPAQWILTQVGSGTGTGGLASASNTTGVLSNGVFNLTTGTTANDLILAEANQRTTATNILFPVSATTENGGFVAMFRFAFGATRTSCKHGCGLIENGIANGTDWITDPDTTLGAGSYQSLIVHRHTSAYGSGGMAAAAGDVVARYYDATVGDQLVTLITSAALAAAPYGASPIKFEFARPPGSTTITCYVNGTAAGTFTTHTAASNWRPSFGVITENTTAKALGMDALWLEAGSAVAAR